MSLPVLEIKNLSKKYDSTTAVDGISFSVSSGEIVGLLGPNGAGKTTAISMVLGLLEPSTGTINIFGKSLEKNRSEIAGRMNFSASFSFLPGNLTVWENLYIFGLLYGVADLPGRISELLQLVQLRGFEKKKTGVLSSGEQSRLSVAKALLNNPELLLLDEPTASLDPQSAQDIRAVICDRAKLQGVAVLWTSHNMHEIEAVCDRVIFLSHGRVLLEGDPKTLPREHGKQSLEELFIGMAKEGLDKQN